MVKTGIVALILALPAAVVSQAQANRFQVAGIDDADSVYGFLSDLQKAVREENASRVAALASLPIEVVIKKDRRRVATRDEFIKRYPDIFDACLKRVVLATTRDQLSASWRGVMLGSGAVWFGQSHGALRLIAINGPIEGEPLCRQTP
jgi:hypothetical protein